MVGVENDVCLYELTWQSSIESRTPNEETEKTN